jgi:hypothetical protein
MKTLKLTLIALSLSISPANGQIPQSSLLDKCDAALEAKILEASLCAQSISLRDKEIERLYKENEKLRERGTGLLDNPAVWATLGLFVGAFVTSRVVR